MNLRQCLILLIVFITPQVNANSLSYLLEKSQQNIATGHYYEAKNNLNKAEKFALAQGDDYHATLVLILNAYVNVQEQHFALAKPSLLAALSKTEDKQWHSLLARTQLYLGELYTRQDNIKEAMPFYQYIIDKASKIKDQSLLVSAFYHLAALNRNKNHIRKSGELLKRAELILKTLPESKTTTTLWLNLGYQALKLNENNTTATDYVPIAYRYLKNALSQAKNLTQLREHASALKYLAQLYQQQRPEESRQLTEKAIIVAQKAQANDILIDLEWFLAKRYTAQKNIPKAMGAYRRAVKHIEAIRLDIPVSYKQGRSSFRDTLVPIYLGLADLLLQQSSQTENSQPLLIEARDVIERMKQSELEDFFQSRCDIAATPIDLKKTDPHAAAIYPVQLADRLDLIVVTAQGLYRFSRDVSSKLVDFTARDFAKKLRNYSDFTTSKPQAKLLHQWLIKPMESLLKQQKISTLIYIPDGALRLLPLEALYDGSRFVVEDYAVVTAVGMSLIESGKTSATDAKVLLAGMSVPGEVIYDLPPRLLGGLLESMNDSGEQYSLHRDVTSTEFRRLSTKEQAQKKKDLRVLLDKPGTMDKIKDMLALPDVETEIKALGEQNNSSYLLNESFSLARFTQELTEKPHQILHIASHGFFGTTANENFIMTHDKVLNVNQLEKILSLDHFKEFPIDLIILSACQTAEGDDRSPLGISGVAIKSNVHSALGSLWPVKDEATAELMKLFYHALKEPTLSKAQALRQVKIALLKQQKFSNPAIWSPFILVGNWL